MRVGLVIYGALNTRSGGYFYDRQLVDYLRRAGDSVQIISMPWHSYPRHLLHNMSAAWTGKMSELKVDLLLQDELNHPSLFWLNRRIRSRVNYPIVSIVHHLRSSERHPAAASALYRVVERAYLKSVDGFIYNSQTTRAAVEKLAGINASGVVATPGGDHLETGVTPEMITRRSHRRGPLKLLYVGNVIRRKNLHLVLAALSLLRDVDWQLDVAGRLDVEPRYAALVQALAKRVSRANGAGSRVHFYGEVPDAGLSQLMTAGQMLVMPSEYEGFGIAYLEGMGFGLVPVAGSSGAAREFICHGQNGFVVDPGDLAGIAAAVRSAACDRAVLDEMAGRARATYMQMPGWEQAGSNIRIYLEGLIA